MAEAGLLSLLPIVVTLAVALAARNVLVGLLVGVVSGVAIHVEVSWVRFVPTLVQDYLVVEVANREKASVLVLLAFIGGFVKLVESSGGGAAFARMAARWVKGKAGAKLGAWAAGIMIFFSDLGTPLIVGPIFQPLTDRLKVSRQQLAFILDSTASPVAILVPFIGWGVFIMSVIAKAFHVNGIQTSEWDAFVSATPYQLYAWLAIAMVPGLTVLGFDYGPMRQAEEAAACGQERPRNAGDPGVDRAGAVLVWLPLVVLGTVLFSTLAAFGFPSQRVVGADFRAALSAAYLLGAGTLMMLARGMGVRRLGDAFGDYVNGMSSMMPVGATLVLAWALGTVSQQLGTGAYVAELATRYGMAGESLPALSFLLAAVVSFATGSSWGTIIIVMPLAVPAAVAVDAAMPVVLGAVLSGGLFGDHASPISETTILSSTGAGTTPLQHFSTQWPYALTNGAIALGTFWLAGDMAFAGMPLVVVAVQFAVLWSVRHLQGLRSG